MDKAMAGFFWRRWEGKDFIIIFLVNPIHICAHSSDYTYHILSENSRCKVKCIREKNYFGKLLLQVNVKFTKGFIKGTIDTNNGFKIFLKFQPYQEIF